MTEEHGFRSPNEELNHLSNEVASVKALLRELSVKISQIERHASRAFGVSPGVGARKNRTQFAQKSVTPTTLTPEEALKLFEEFVSLWRSGNAPQVEKSLEEMNIDDMKLMAYELGVTFKSKPSKKTLGSGILRRINEAVMLSKNINITSPRSESASPKENSPRLKISASSKDRMQSQAEVITKDLSAQHNLTDDEYAKIAMASECEPNLMRRLR